MTDPPISDELAALVMAKKEILPEAVAADVLESIGNGADWISTLRALQDLQAEALGTPNDTGMIERMLLAQATTLQNLFTHYMTRANRSAELPKFQAFGDLALKAQNQCRRTLATLAEIRNPRRTQFIKQVNNALNQQVNNSSGATETREIPDSGANKLLEVDDAQGRRLDFGSAALAIGDDASMETVGAVNRPHDARR